MGFLPLHSRDDNWVLLNEASTWASNDMHHGAFLILITDRAIAIGKELGIVDAKGKSVVHRDARCVACHSGIPLKELQRDQDGLISAEMLKLNSLIHGVDCEGCHGAAGGTKEAKGWEAKHISKQEWRFLTAEQKQEQFGMYNLFSPVSKSQLCLSCHQGNLRAGRFITPEMYRAGHPPLPRFEVETFLSQMPRHWRDLDEKAVGIREEWLKKCKQKFDINDHMRAQRVLLNSLVYLNEQLKLIADLCDHELTIPIESPSWIEYAPNVLPESRYAELKKCFDKRNISKRPPSQWSVEMARLACDFTTRHRGAGFDDRMTKVERSMNKALEGDTDLLKRECRETSEWLTSVISDLERKEFSPQDADRLMAQLCEIGANRNLDYDTARQFVWAFHIVRSERMRKRNPNSPFNDDAFYKTRSLDQLSGWIESNNKFGPVEIAMALMSEVFLLDLRDGRIEEMKLEENLTPWLIIRKHYEIDASFRKNYTPEKAKDRFARLQKYGPFFDGLGD